MRYPMRLCAALPAAQGSCRPSGAAEAAALAYMRSSVLFPARRFEGVLCRRGVERVRAGTKSLPLSASSPARSTRAVRPSMARWAGWPGSCEPALPADLQA